jgi:hypothetical protein
MFSTTTYPLTPKIRPHFKDKIHELAQIHNIEINIYDLEGKSIKIIKESFSVDKVSPPIPKYILKLVRSLSKKTYVDIKRLMASNRSSFTK